MSSTDLSSQTNETPEELEHSEVLDNSNAGETSTTEENQVVPEESTVNQEEGPVEESKTDESKGDNLSSPPPPPPPVDTQSEEQFEENSLPPSQLPTISKEEEPLSEIQKQFNEVITLAPVLESEKISHSFSNIIGNEKLNYQNILNQCYLDNQIVVPIKESSDFVLLSKYNQISENQFYCCKTHSIGEINYKTRLFTITKTLNKDDNNDNDNVKVPPPTERTENIMKKLDEYLNEEFEGDKGYHVEERKDENNKTIIIYSICLNQKDISGYWNCNYEVNNENNKISGSCRVNIHHSDESSVDMKYTKKVEEKEMKDEDEIINLFKSVDGEILTELSDYFCSEKDDWLKDFRRQLPISKVKFNWENVGGF